MIRLLGFIVGLAALSVNLSSQGRPVVVVNAFTVVAGVELPYDMELLQKQLVPELKVLLGKQFDVVAEEPQAAQGAVYVLHGEISGWRAGNAAKRLIVGLGSGREASDIQYRITDASGTTVVDQKDTVRTNFYSQQAGSSGTLAHPIAQKLAERLRDARLK